MFPWLSNIPLYGQATFCLSSHLFLDIWIVSTLWLLRTVAARSFSERVFMWMCVFILSDLHPAMELPGPLGNSDSPPEEGPACFPKWLQRIHFRLKFIKAGWFKQAVWGGRVW